MLIRLGVAPDAERCQQIARANKGAFGFIRRVWLEEAAAKRRLLVAELDGTIVGFVHFNHTRYGPHSSIYEIAVDPAVHGQGIGSAMLAWLKQDAWEHERRAILLRCPVGLPANDWYQRRRFVWQGLKGVEGKRSVNIWRLEVGDV